MTVIAIVAGVAFLYPVPDRRAQTGITLHEAIAFTAFLLALISFFLSSTVLSRRAFAQYSGNDFPISRHILQSVLAFVVLWGISALLARLRASEHSILVLPPLVTAGLDSFLSRGKLTKLRLSAHGALVLLVCFLMPVMLWLVGVPMLSLEGFD